MCHVASPPQTDGSQSHYLEKMKKKKPALQCLIFIYLLALPTAKRITAFLCILALALA